MSERRETAGLVSSSPAQTERIAAQVAADLLPGDVVLLFGELGSGKSVFVRGAAGALGHTGRITSPTFAIGNVYRGAAHEIAHLDLYRLDSLTAADEALLEDFVTPERIAFVEWPHAEAAALPGVRAKVSLAHAGGDRRTIEIDWIERP